MNIDVCDRRTFRRLRDQIIKILKKRTYSVIEDAMVGEESIHLFEHFTIRERRSRLLDGMFSVSRTLLKNTTFCEDSLPLRIAHWLVS